MNNQILSPKSQSVPATVMNGALGGKIHHIRFLPLLILAMLVNILSQSTHETGHLMVYQIRGRDPVWGFTKIVQIWDTPPVNPNVWVEIRGTEGEPGWLKLSSPLKGKAENVIASAAGPLAGLLGAVLGLVLARWSRKITWQQIGLVFSLAASLVAVLYYLRSPIRTGGDEYDIAVQLGIAKPFVEGLLLLAFIACLMLGLRILPTWRTRLYWLGTILLGSVVTGIPMVMADPFVIAQVDTGNPWFQSVLGYSLPVFVVILLTCVGICAWSRWQNKKGFTKQNFIGVQNGQ